MTDASCGSVEDAVRFEQVVVRYGDIVALDHATFRLRPGETVAMLGPNGAGKSTAVDVLLGLRTPAAGKVRVLGGPPARAVAAGRVGAMLQHAGLPAGAGVAEIVELARALYRNGRSRDELLAMAGLAGLARRRVEKLSGGQAQRVRFALALAGRPDLLFLDEATVALDVEARREFWRIVREVTAEGATVLFTTHDLHEADAYADRIVVLHRGRVIADGAPSTVKAGITDRTVRCTLDAPDPVALGALPGVLEVSVRGREVVLRTKDADATMRSLYATVPTVQDLQVTGADLEEALLALTAEPPVLPTAS